MNKTIVSLDYAIKYLLKNKGDYDIIEAFVSAILKRQGYGPVKILALLDTESNKEEIGQKKSIADLVVEDENGIKYIIEIERQQVISYVHKACFNTARLIADQLPMGDDYLSIKKIFHISLLYFSIGHKGGSIYHGKTVIREMSSGEKLTVHIEDKFTGRVIDATDIFPEYVFIPIPEFDDKVNEELDEWLYVLKHSEVREDFKSNIMQKVAEKLSILHMTIDERNAYLHYKKEVATFKDAAEFQFDKGKIEGREEGIRVVAKNLLNSGMTMEAVSGATGLDMDVIRALK